MNILKVVMSFSPDFYFAVLAVLVAGTLRGFSGFGAGMILVPSLGLLYTPMVAVITVVLLETIPAIQLLPDAIRKCHWRSVVPMLLMAIIAVPVGSFILIKTDPNAMRVGISVLVILCVVILATGWRYKGEYTPKASALTGMASGLISGATSLGGLPIILYYLSGEHSAQVARASIVVFLIFTAIVSLVAYIAHGIITAEIVVRTGSLMPFFMVAIWIGSHLFGKVSETLFRSITLVLLGCVGLMMLFS